MEYMEYLDRIEIEIIKLVEKAGYKTIENTQLCLLSDAYVGFLDKRKKLIIIFESDVKILIIKNEVILNHCKCSRKSVSTGNHTYFYNLRTQSKLLFQK